MKWVSAAALFREGWIDIGDFSDPAYIRKLADNSDSNAERRQHVFDAFRDPEVETVAESQYKLPYMAGSGINYENSPKRYYMMPELQYSILERWRDGDFINDFDEIDTAERQNITSIDQLPLAEQPHALTKAALEPLSGGAFHPGVELTWVLERPELFDEEEPFRLAVGDRERLSANMGPLITPENTLPTPETKANQPYWPVGPQSPGDLTRWMGLPWQPDAFSCQNINFANDFPTLVWWPALLPVQVIPEYAYKQMLNPNISTEARLTFANTRAAWSRGVAGLGYHVNGSYFDGLNRMVYLWEQMGFVVKKEVPAELTDNLGEFIYVETERGSMDLQFRQMPSLGLEY
ncbi:MAG: LodA/GoxA family CTQ-dependent oxidase [Chloroflexota bacterium]